MGAEFLAGRALAVKTVEDRGQLVLGNARAVILDADQNGATVAAGMDADRAIRRAERDGIRDHVDKDLRQPALDAGNGQVALMAGDIERQLRRPVGAGGLMHVDQGSQHRPDVGRRDLQAAQLGIEPRCVGNIADQPVQPLDIVLNDRHQPAPLDRIVDPRRGLDRAAQRG